MEYDKVLDLDSNQNIKQKDQDSPLTTTTANPKEAEYQNMNISDISSLNLHRNIEKLNLSYNVIETLPKLFLSYSKLVYLDLSYNELSSVDCIRNCVNLRILLLKRNNLKNLQFVFYLKSLEHIDLAENLLIINSTIIRYLKCNNQLISICLEGNYNYDFNAVKFAILEVLDTIEYLDNVKIYSKNEIKLVSVYTSYKTKNGDNLKVKNIKDYIKAKKYDYSLNNEYYDNLKSTVNMAKSKPKTKTKKSSYFFQNNIDIKDP